MDTRLPVLINLVLGLAAWALVRHWTGSECAAFVAGVGVAVSLTLFYTVYKASSDANDDLDDRFGGYR